VKNLSFILRPSTRFLSVSQRPEKKFNQKKRILLGIRPWFCTRIQTTLTTMKAMAGCKPAISLPALYLAAAHLREMVVDPRQHESGDRSIYESFNRADRYSSDRPSGVKSRIDGTRHLQEIHSVAWIRHMNDSHTQNGRSPNDSGSNRHPLE
jgi:hypothetical protein